MNPRGTIQRSFTTQDGTRMWLVAWSRGAGPAAVPCTRQFETGQAVELIDGQLVRARR